MKRHFILLAFLLVTQIAFAWGQTGHRVVGEIAWQHLTKKAQKNVQRLLGSEQLGMVGNWMDFIKSEPSYDSLKAWHYCTVPEGKTYAEVGAPEQGDAVMAINKFITELETGNYSVDEVFALKCLVHLVGDIHQPLHCGNGTDRGGNDVKVEYMWKKTNLHRIWDTDMIDGQQLSYTEYVNWINTATKDQVAKWQNSTVLDWVAESQEMHLQVYDYPESGKLGYRYTYDNIDALNKRLAQAGIRLAGILNNIYG
jgi:hypothetical protein